MEKSKPKITGIGGIFFKSSNPEKIKNWYADHLGFNTDEYGVMFKFRKDENPQKTAYLQWSPFNNNTEYFKPSEKEFMINYRVENIDGLVENLIEKGVDLIGKVQSFEYGKFAHIMDPEGNKIELWEPIDDSFDSEEK
ncbi:MAG: VOC family protein [Candidatus Marinimicrobia bacterium]|nr:VOC family protein [Candidatus Neomarinimicrobiota bacterium]MBT3634978.1 VOC family protein [Candidatus Neomarinimicrobiota bacterium]MBT3683683.1 VOC family protein [Candidatus Neomarinimicrobiota bacterium]MBT3760823.1 VOC family protein [Candidatus Neomarinimicrobiota bacterium]MBT3896893.1 VOC family protein [Candidatus Neomarinimicrobiota bacterium]